MLSWLLRTQFHKFIPISVMEQPDRAVALTLCQCIDKLCSFDQWIQTSGKFSGHWGQRVFKVIKVIIMKLFVTEDSEAVRKKKFKYLLLVCFDKFVSHNLTNSPQLKRPCYQRPVSLYESSLDCSTRKTSIF